MCEESIRKILEECPELAEEETFRKLQEECGITIERRGYMGRKIGKI